MPGASRNERWQPSPQLINVEFLLGPTNRIDADESSDEAVRIRTEDVIASVNGERGVHLPTINDCTILRACSRAGEPPIDCAF
jgi:hypothetical protein